MFFFFDIFFSFLSFFFFKKNNYEILKKNKKIAHVPSDQTKIFDNVSLQVLLVDVLDNKYFASNFALSYAGNITVYYRNLDTSILIYHL